MKKLLKVLFAGALLCTMAACTNAASAAEKTVNSYFSALEAGNMDDTSQYVKDGTSTGFDTITTVETNMEDLLAQYDVTDATKQKFTDAFSDMIKLCIQSHKITKTEKVSDTEYKVTVEATILDSDSISSALANIDTSSIISDISATVVEKYQSEGEAAAADFMMSSIADWFSKNYVGALKNLQTSSETIVITVDQVDKAWLITSMSEQS